jgi:hypothetical protein
MRICSQESRDEMRERKSKEVGVRGRREGGRGIIAHSKSVLHRLNQVMVIET